MPIYEFRCGKCDAVTEKLIRKDDEIEQLSCTQCGAEVSKILSTFRIDGATPKTSDASLAASGRDFSENPDKFVKAMDAFGEKVGSPLTKTEKERAVERLKK